MGDKAASNVAGPEMKLYPIYYVHVLSHVIDPDKILKIISN